MDLTSQILIAALVVGSIAFQYGRRQLNLLRLALPIAGVAYAGARYLTGIPTEGGDLLFATVGLLSGAALGVFSSWLMGVERVAGKTYLVAGVAYVAMWVAVFAARLAFAWGVQNVFGHQVGVFSYQHQLTAAGWIAFFILQAIAMVAARTVVIGARALVAMTQEAHLLPA